MTNIPLNEDMSEKEVETKLTNKILEGLKTKGSIQLYWNEIPNKEIALNVARKFAKKRYHAQAYFFVESWKGIGGLQKIEISKKPLQECNARLVFSEPIH